MKKAVKILLLLLFAAACISIRAQAVDVVGSQSEALDTEEMTESMPGDVSEMLDGVEISENTDFGEGMKLIWGRVGSHVPGILKGALQSAVMILLIAILCNIADGICESGALPGSGSYIELAGVLAIAAISVANTGTYIGLGRETVQSIDQISKAVLPTLTAAATASGSLTAAATKYAASAFCMDVLLKVASGILIPVIYAYIAAVVGEAAFGGEGLSGAAGFLKWLATSILTLLVLAFIIYLSLSGVVSGAADAVTLRLAKTTISTTLPVVGSIVSDAASAVLAGGAILKNAIGVFGMLAVCAVCLVPFLRLAAHYLLYKAVSKLTASVSGNRISRLIGGIANAFGLVMGMTGASALMLFFSLISLIKVASG